MIVAQIGARMHYAVPRILHEHHTLSMLYTDICSVKGYGKLSRIISTITGNKYAKKLEQRIPHGLPAEKINTFDYFGLRYFFSLRNSPSNIENRKIQLWAQTLFPKLILGRTELNDSIYAFNGAGLELFTAAKNNGFKAVLEQTIAPLEIEYELTQKEYEKHPEWIMNSKEMEMDKYTRELIKREKQEWKRADLIICGSDFVKDGVVQCGGAEEKCVVVPYGVLPINNVLSKEISVNKKKLNVLTVGTLELRKGIPYVLQLAKEYKDYANFRLVGLYDHLSPNIIKDLAKHVELIGTVPRNQVKDHYRWADIFLFPSICEGSATVIYEAMSYGLPVITTRNSGSIIRNNIDGIIVEASHFENMQKKFDDLITSRDSLLEISKASKERFNSFGHYEHYKSRLVNVLKVE